MKLEPAWSHDATACLTLGQNTDEILEQDTAIILLAIELEQDGQGVDLVE